MHFSLLNLYSALAIGLVITSLATVRSTKAKATLYVLPIPISIGLIATHGVVSVSNLIGLMLVWVFLFICQVLTDTYRLHILISDVIASVLYILLGYLLIHHIHWPFYSVALLFVLFWSVIVMWMRQHPIKEKPPKPSALPAVVKGAVASSVSFAIYSFKDLLKGIVVTFPYNGIFAVIEVRHHLEPFVRSVIRNTIAVDALFITMHYGGPHLLEVWNFVVGWAVFGLTLWAVQKISV